MTVVVQLLSHVLLFATPWTAARQAPWSFTNSWSLLNLMSLESVMPSSHLVLGQSLLLLPSIFPSIRVFPNASVLRIRWPKYWNFSFNVSPSNEYSGLIPFEIDWFCLLAVQGILQGKNHSFDYTDFVGNVMFLLFNMLSRFVTVFLTRSKHLIIF